MSEQLFPVRPPRLASWLVTIFTPDEQLESILGDLQEEFSALVEGPERRRAQTWFWRKAWRTAMPRVTAGMRAAPWLTLTTVLAGYVLKGYVLSRLPEAAILAIFERNQLAERHFEAYQFWISDGIVMALALNHFLTGMSMALAAKGREMAVTVALAVLSLFLSATAYATLLVARPGQYGFLNTVPHVVAFALAMVLGGLAVRVSRLGSSTGQSAVQQRP